MMKISKSVVSITLMLGMVISGSALADNLYPGERLVQLGEYPALTRFFKGDPRKPLLVFIPGAHHLARISYGGHQGSDPADFLAYWIVEQGYNFLAVSYPVDVPAGVFPTAYPAFSAQDWGKTVALAAAQAVTENRLSRSVIFLHWSMAGKVISPAFRAARAQGLDVLTAISLAATPGIPETAGRRFQMAPSGYVHRSDNYRSWLVQIRQDDAVNRHTIIPEDVYRREYVGDMAVGLQGNGEVYRNNRFVFDVAAQTADYGAFDFREYPLVTVLQDSDKVDGHHALTDCQTWMFYDAQMLSRTIGARAASLSDSDWPRLLGDVQGLSNSLCFRVGGNHFFFLGRKGARKTALAVHEAVLAAQKLRGRLQSVSLPQPRPADRNE